ncbi:MAG TPA: hypothetical protein VMZ28_01105 [Kofleriaceae bacterium]|nr:hypothetical protein [Kofleriaceae bacterium]
MTATLIELARAVLTPVDAPASFVSSQVIGPDLDEDPGETDEWIALDPGVARRMVGGGAAAVLRVEAAELAMAPRLAGLFLEVVLRGDDRAAATDIARALDAGAPVRALLASGPTGIDAYRAAACARHVLGTRVPIRVRWDDVLDCKGAALALSFGADELAGPLAAPPLRIKLAQVGGPPEDSGRPSPAYVESLIRAAGRLPDRRRR